MHALATLFLRVKSVHFHKCAYSDYENGLLDAVTHMELLHSINLPLQQSVRFPKDVLASLSFARSSGRFFSLTLDHAYSEPLRLCTDIAREQWVKMSEGLAGPSVTLE